MITIKEIKARIELPYKYEAPYYSNPTNGYDRYRGGVYNKTYYDVHGGSMYDDILSYLEQLPDTLRKWIMDRISTAMESGKIEYVTNDAIFAYIDIAHFYYYGVFAE